MFGYIHLQVLALAAFSLPFLVPIQSPRPPFAPIELVWLLFLGKRWGTGSSRNSDPSRGIATRSVRWTLALFTPSELFLRMVALVGLRCHGREHVWMAPDLDRIGGGLVLLKVTGIPWRERQPSRAVEWTIELTNGRRVRSSRGFLRAWSKCR